MNKTSFFDLPVAVTKIPPLPTLMIPFSSGPNQISLQFDPNPTGLNSTPTVGMCGFGSSTVVPMGYGEDKSDIFIGVNTNSVYAFNVATDISLVSITAEIIPTLNLTPTYTISPYVALAIATPMSDVFKIIPETITYIATQNSYTANTLYSNIKEDIPVSIPAGSRVAIICGLETDTPPTRFTASFYFSGGVAMW